MDYVIDKIDWYMEVIKEDPSSYVFTELAELLYEDGRFEEVVTVCRACLETQPHNLKGRLFLALGLFQLGQEREAERLLWDLKEEIKCFSSLFWACSEIENNRGNKKVAKNLLKIAYAINPDNERVLSRLDEWNIRDIEVIDLVPKVTYTKSMEEHQFPSSQEVETPAHQEEKEKARPLLEFAKFAIRTLDQKIAKFPDQTKELIPEKSLFDDEIKQIIRKYVSLCLRK